MTILGSGCETTTAVVLPLSKKVPGADSLDAPGKSKEYKIFLAVEEIKVNCSFSIPPRP